MYHNTTFKNQRSLNPLHLLSQFLLLALVLFCTTGCGSQRTIVNALDEKEANEIIVFLASKGIAATKFQSLEGTGPGSSKVVLWDVKVDETQGNEAMALLNQAGLPRKRSQSLLGIFAGGGLVPSELQEKIRYQAGLAEQISSTIRKIDGILDAEVQISFPEDDPLNPGVKKGKITSSVYVKHNGVLDDPNSHLITKIKRLVAASITGLDYDNVTVIGDRARYGNSPATSLSGSTEEAKQYTNVWTIILAKESATRFQIIFFSFILTILLLLSLLTWIIWKLVPVLHSSGGFKSLFSLHPLTLEKPETEALPEQDDQEKTDTDKDNRDEGVT